MRKIAPILPKPTKSVTMAAHPDDFAIENGILKSVSNNYIKKNNGYYEIPHSVTAIGRNAFYKCTNLKQITIPDSVTSICSCAFSHCTNLKQVTIPDSVTTIGVDGFMNCSNLKSITISDSITSIDICALSNCHKDLEITITTFDLSKEKATALKEELQERYPEIKIHIDTPLERLKGIPTFFSKSGKQEEAESSPTNSPR